MYSKNNERGKLLIHEIKSKEHSRGKLVRKEEREHFEYGTDQKGKLDISQGSDLEFKDATVCSHCRARMSQFVTKKPTHPIEKGVQTSQKPFLVDLIE